ncbi:DUF2917 domain-containing protein [Acidovorax sp.]|uniref:DUF2917 domain-containing protein n=1 Tax=Acidovorax sp. TaxID=1872122 RepID=UPI0026311104|nr:DUF2917 domain-containing protein [Acidovorax sp.]
MFARNVLESQQSVQAAVAGRSAAGCWKLANGRALSLHPREPGVLEIAEGRVWLTLSALSGTSSADLPADLPRGVADHVLVAGDRFAVAAGQHLVMEAWGAADSAGAVAFNWEGAAAPTASATACDWECGVLLPLRDLGQALAQGGRALGTAWVGAAGAGGRLALGLARFALHWIALQRPRKPA